MNVPQRDILEGWWAQSAFSYCDTLQQRLHDFREEESRLERVVREAVAAADEATVPASAGSGRRRRDAQRLRERRERIEQEARARAALAQVRAWIAYLLDVRTRLVNALGAVLPGTPPGTPPWPRP